MPVVNTVFGRPGPHVVAELGDYAASLIANDSSVPGDSVAEAQDELASEVLTRVTVAADLEGTAATPRVAKIQGYAVQNVAPGDGDVLTWSAVNGRWEPKPQAPSSASGYEIIADVNFVSAGSTTGNAASSPRNVPFTEVFGGITFTVTTTNSGIGYGEGDAPPTQNVNTKGYRLAGIGSGNFVAGDSMAYLITDIQLLPGYVAGRKYACLAVVDYNIAREVPESRAHVGCFKPGPYYPGQEGWITLTDNSGFGCGPMPRGDLGQHDYKPTMCAPVVGESNIVDRPDRALSQLRAYTHSYDMICGVLRRVAGYAEGVVAPYSGSAPTIESMLAVGGIQTLYSGAMSDLRWGVLWKGSVGGSARHQQYCYVRRMIFYQSKE